ncbi:MAG: glutathione S-transferase family protein [Leptospirales bacterium]|jgi:glutathione S-transferase
MAEAKLKLYGFPTSNYYNKIKLALLEKNIAHEEVRIGPSQEEDFLRRSPMGKIPFIESEGRFIFESSVIFEFLERLHPQPPLLPADPYEAARVREIIAVIDLHLDAPARRLFATAFRGAPAAPELMVDVEKKLSRGTRALKQLAKFQPFIAGADYTYADAAAYATLSLMESVTTRLFPGQAGLADAVPGYGEYQAMLSQRPATKKVDRARKAVERAQAIAAKKTGE